MAFLTPEIVKYRICSITIILYFVLDDSIVDAGGKMGYSYPGEVTMYPQETPVGATCEGQVCIGVDNPGSFKINVEHYDGNDVEQKATFNVTVDQ